jgi:hypothetical protein
VDKCADFRVDDPMMRVVFVVGLAFILLTSGCAGVKTPPPLAPSQSSSPQVDAVAALPAVPQPRLPSASPPTVEAQVEVAAVEPTIGFVAPSAGASPNQTAGKTTPPVAKAPAKIPASPAPAVQAIKRDSSPTDAAKANSPPLDLASLEQRLKGTKAIGVLTKITIKNQVDDLLDQFRAFYQGKLRTTMADLRRSYDLLVLKVLSLLQDGDQALATAIAASREAIWGILSDPAKFAAI